MAAADNACISVWPSTASCENRLALNTAELRQIFRSSEATLGSSFAANIRFGARRGRKKCLGRSTSTPSIDVVVCTPWKARSAYSWACLLCEQVRRDDIGWIEESHRRKRPMKSQTVLDLGPKPRLIPAARNNKKYLDKYTESTFQQLLRQSSKSGNATTNWSCEQVCACQRRVYFY